MRSSRYRDIAQAVAREIAGQPPGTMLPSEADLSRTHRVSRVTVRRALEVLRADGLVAAKQGLGWFVAHGRVSQVLGVLGTIEEQMAANGVRSERRILEFAVEAAPAEVREVLGCDRALRVKRVNTADGEPFALVTVWCPEPLARTLTREALEQSPFYELLDVPLTGATQTIAAGAASRDEARLLGVPAGSPVLRCQRVTRGRDGEPVLVSRHVFPGGSTSFVVELPSADRSIAPSGLRLVD